MNHERRKPERRRTFVIDAEKFATQRLVTYVLLLVFAAVVANVLVGADQAERSTILQTVINLTLIAVGYWLGSSKSASDTPTVAPIAPLAPIAAIAPLAPIAPVAPVTPPKVDE